MAKPHVTHSNLIFVFFFFEFSITTDAEPVNVTSEFSPLCTQHTLLLNLDRICSHPYNFSITKCKQIFYVDSEIKEPINCLINQYLAHF